MKKFITHSSYETQEIAEKLAKGFKKGVIALSGNLGSGKTTFTQGFAKGLGIKDKIISPTFVLIRQHKIPSSKRILFHVDLYRLENTNQMKSLGLKDLLNNPNAIVLIEWAEKAKDLLSKNSIVIELKIIGQNKREIKIFNIS